MIRTVLWGSAVSALFIMGIMMSNVLILGEETMKRLYFPYYIAVSMIELGDFITHIEVIAVIIFILTLLVKAGVGVSVVSDSFRKLFKVTKPEKLLFPIIFFIAVISLRLFFNAQQMSLITEFNKYIGFVFQLPIPLFALICAEIRKRKIKR